jgi:hypothetical protein
LQPLIGSGSRGHTKAIELGDSKTDATKKMVTISATASEDKTQNCVVTPKKKAIAASSNSTSTATGNSSSAENNADQTAPNILVYKKVSGVPVDFVGNPYFCAILDGSNCGANASRERWCDGAHGEGIHVEDPIGL